MHKRMRLPVDSDLSWSSLDWAKWLLAEAPTALVVSPIDAGITFSSIPIEVDLTMKTNSWKLVGPNGEVYSDGA